MSKRPALAKSELEIARIVWQLGKGTVREVVAALPTNRSVDFKTVQTYLRRLEAKGYLRSEVEGRSKVYFSRVRPKNVVRQIVDDMISRVFDGESIPLFQHLINERGMSESELTELRAILDKLKEQK
jgi:BlaI family transcriptional regulator, penicillinase repressor